MHEQSRRDFIKSIGYASAVCCFPFLHCQTQQKNPPNVLFISMDDLNDWIEPLGGHPQAKTPHLSRLASQSVNFTNAYCASPMCNPSRTALMTGLAPYHSGMYSNYQDWREVITNHKSIGTYFREHGYYSAGASCQRIVSLQDIYPTLIELCGLLPRPEIDGHSLVPLLQNPAIPCQ